MQYPQHDLTPRLTHQGLEAKEISSPSGRGRKLPLTSPLIDQAISLIDLQERTTVTKGGAQPVAVSARALSSSSPYNQSLDSSFQVIS